MCVDWSNKAIKRCLQCWDRNGKYARKRQDKSVGFLAGAALCLISSQRGETVMEKYIAWHPHHTVGDTSRDTGTIGWRHAVRVLACWTRCDRQGGSVLFLACCDRQVSHTSRSCEQTHVDRYIGSKRSAVDMHSNFNLLDCRVLNIFAA